ncbi:type I-E CRISPR-associated protein Cas7/Cse4/CasC [Streptomyces sp. MST-110588]|uniref:type I-E CRISPR-associated protein Cas7/Cse4/CasC n=1 Tax=Streptomyces sp. MST-110588 TaxID=2833628 RepID=UPI001F5C34AA|nr:type I-E CRISPR-associated protein Cas7/Cse4/CasC [Streptomyces sp. MST-110588]UNO42201.1 type I-E CRISPR-associated protein Cas7/Cse4/CasC [Streptomyces sp. MST-110588]
MTLLPPRLYVDVHILQTVPPANLNRDDQGNPKEAYYGGTRRSRVSSQAWKRATRMHFTEYMPADDLATRTRRVASDLTCALRTRTGLEEEPASRLADALLAPLKISAGRKRGDTAYLLFYGRRQLDNVVGLVGDRAAELAALDDKDLQAEVEQLAVEEQFSTGHPLDVALFGRMVADIAALRVDAAVQVAHALSTHAVSLEFDYFTAVDDLVEEERETGAGMIGSIGFNSATLYRYATVSLQQLRENLGNDAAAVDGTRKFLTSFARSVPSGYRNSFAHQTLPSLVSVVVRSDQPVNLVTAYEKPVAPSAGIAAESARCLAEEHRTAVDGWGEAPAFSAVCHAFRDETAQCLEEAFGPAVTFPELLNGLDEYLSSAIAEAGR